LGDGERLSSHIIEREAHTKAKVPGRSADETIGSGELNGGSVEFAMGCGTWK
jgi:hypothetical protein